MLQFFIRLLLSSSVAWAHIFIFHVIAPELNQDKYALSVTGFISLQHHDPFFFFILLALSW